MRWTRTSNTCGSTGCTAPLRRTSRARTSTSVSPKRTRWACAPPSWSNTVPEGTGRRAQVTVPAKVRAPEDVDVPPAVKRAGRRAPGVSGAPAHGTARRPRPPGAGCGRRRPRRRCHRGAAGAPVRPRPPGYGRGPARELARVPSARPVHGRRQGRELVQPDVGRVSGRAGGGRLVAGALGPSHDHVVHL